MEDSRTDLKKSSSKIRQILAAASANLSIISCGIALGWPSPMLDKLKNSDKNPLNIEITENQGALIGSLVMIAAVFGPMYSGFVAQLFGRKLMLLISGIPITVGCILLITARYLWEIYLARVLWGLALGQLFTCVSMYVGEISAKNIRGSLGTFLQAFLSFGYVFSYCIGPFTSYVVFNIICLVPVVAFMCTFIFMPESPVWYVMKGEKEKALASLLWLRNESQEEAEEELEILINWNAEKSKQKVSYFNEMKKKGNIKAFLLAGGLLVFQQFSGVNVVKFYLQDLFEDADTGISPVLSAILVGILQFLSACFTPFVVDIWGRRVMLMISSIGMTIGLTFLGLYFFLADRGSSAVDNLSWLPITSVMLFVLTFCLGFGPIAWAILGELFDTSVKERNMSIISSFTFLLGFIISRYFTNVKQAIGEDFAFWIFAIFCILAFLFVKFFLPETKGKSMQEIQALLNE